MCTPGAIQGAAFTGDSKVIKGWNYTFRVVPSNPERDVVTVKGDDIAGLLAVVQPVPPADAQPRVVILDSIKGQGVPCLEQLTNSHHLRLTDGMKQTLNEAIHQLEVMHD